MTETPHSQPSPLLIGSYIKVLRDHELAIAYLYRLLAKSQKPLQAFWTALAEEEVVHSRILEAMEKRLLAGTLQFKRPDFYYRKVEEAIEHLQSQAQTVVNPGLSIREALSCAIRMEQNMIESRFFEVLNGDDEQTRRELNDINRFNQHHVTTLLKEAGRWRWRWFGHQVFKCSST